MEVCSIRNESNSLTSTVPSRTKHACTNCRKNKVKCNGISPSCERCLLKGLECIYEVPKIKEKKNGINLVKEKVANLEVEINVQKQLADYWKRMFDELSPKAAVQPSLQTLKLLKSNKLTVNEIPPYERVDINEDMLLIMNYMKDYVIQFGVSTTLGGEVESEWNLLSVKCLTSDNFKDYCFSDLVHLWNRCIVFIAPCVYTPYPYQEHVLWSNAVTLMRLVVYGKDLQRHPQLLPQIICTLSNMHRYLSLTDKIGAKSSCIILAFQLASQSQDWIPSTLMDNIKIELILNSTSDSERQQWIDRLEFESTNPLLSLKYKLAYCASALSLRKEIDFDMGLDISHKLNEVESLAKEVHKDHFNLVVKCRSYLLRSEVAYRQGYIELSKEWLESSYRILTEFEDVKVVRFTYSLFLLIKKELSALPTDNTPGHIMDEMIQRIENEWLEVKLASHSRHTIVKHLFNSVICLPQLQLHSKEIFLKLKVND